MSLTTMGAGAAGGAWTPASLSGLAVTLLPAESRSAGLLWQNSAKTTPASADGDPVRVAVCPYTAVEFTAPSDAARPLLWDEGGGNWSLNHDGIDDGMSLAASVVLTDFEVWVAGYRPTNNCIMVCGPTGVANPQFRINNPANKMTASNDAATTATASSTIPTVCPAKMSVGFSRAGTALTYYQSSASVSTATLAGTSTVRRIGFAGEFGAAFFGRVGGLVICTAEQTAANRASLVAALDALN